MDSARVSLLSTLLYYKTTISSSDCHKDCEPIRISTGLSVKVYEMPSAARLGMHMDGSA